MKHYHRMFILFLEDSEGRICTVMSIFFLFCKTETVILQTGKNKSTISYCLLKQKYIQQKMNPHLFSYEWETDTNKGMNKNTVCF